MSNNKRSLGRTGGRFRRARARVLSVNQICAFRGNGKWPPCGQLIDMSLKHPDPMSATVNHIVPVSKLAWDDPLCYDVTNMEPMHLVCNQRLSDGGGRKEKNKRKHRTSRNWFE